MALLTVKLVGGPVKKLTEEEDSPANPESIVHKEFIVCYVKQN
jgi:hypothetical protein